MQQLKKDELINIVPIFKEAKDTLIWSCLQGHMGNAWADNVQAPKCAQIITADFCFHAGDSQANEALLLVKNIPAFYQHKCIYMIPQNELWGALIEQAYPNQCYKFKRYAIKKEKNIFDTEKLQGYIERLPTEFELVPFDENLYTLSSKEGWSSDFCSQFPTYGDFSKRGLGFAVLHAGQFVCGATSYTIYEEGIEIEIDTKEEYRRKGLATACASRLILECLHRGLYPSWDAANLESVALAEKLGYHFDREYITYEVHCK